VGNDTDPLSYYLTSLKRRPAGLGCRMEELIKFVAKALVEAPDQVQVIRKETRRTTILKLQVAPDDTGRVIGKHGRVAGALRSLLNVATRHEERDIILEID